MNNYNSSFDNCENHIDHLTEPKRSFMNQPIHRSEAIVEKNEALYNQDMGTLKKAWEDVSNSNNIDPENHGYHNNEYGHQYEEYKHGLKNVTTKPSYNYSEIYDEQMNKPHMEEEAHRYVKNEKDHMIDQEHSSRDMINFNQLDEYHNTENNNKCESNHAIKHDNSYHKEYNEPPTHLYNKKKSIFNPDHADYHLNATRIVQNNIYGDYEKNEQKENNRNDNNRYDNNRYNNHRYDNNKNDNNRNDNNRNDNNKIYNNKDYNNIHNNNPYQFNEVSTKTSKDLNEFNRHEEGNHSNEHEYLGERRNCYLKNDKDEIQNKNYSMVEPNRYHDSNDIHNNGHFRDDISICSSTFSKPREDAHFYKEKNMSHTNIFDFVDSNKYDENGKDGISRKKKSMDTFVPRYKNVSAREALLKNLLGNDSITVLAANSMIVDTTVSPDKISDSLPNVYPFNVSDRLKLTEIDEEKKKRIPKLLPTNYNYVNNYNKNNGHDVTLSQIRNNMNSSHIFDTQESYEEEQKDLLEKEKNTLPVEKNWYNDKALKDQKDTMEIQDKRKNNPMYTEMFGRKTPDTSVTQKEKLLSMTMQNNWMYHASDVKKYAEPFDEQKTNQGYENVDPYEHERFYRKSYFGKDGYDNTKRLQEALKKGSTFALQAHLQSSFQSQDIHKKNPHDINKVETFYLKLYNIKDSLTDDDIKRIVRDSQAHLVSYQPDYDLLSNIRKPTAKLCIRHNKGKMGLECLQNMLLEVQIKAMEQ